MEKTQEGGSSGILDSVAPLIKKLSAPLWEVAGAAIGGLVDAALGGVGIGGSMIGAAAGAAAESVVTRTGEVLRERPAGTSSSGVKVPSDTLGRRARAEVARWSDEVGKGPKDPRETLFGQWNTLLRKVSFAIPVVIVVDHAEAIDSATVFFLENLLKSPAKERILIICVQREENDCLQVLRTQAGEESRLVTMPVAPIRQRFSPDVPDGEVGDCLALVAEYGPVAPIAWVKDMIRSVTSDDADVEAYLGEMEDTDFILIHESVAVFPTLTLWNAVRCRSVSQEKRDAAFEVLRRQLDDPAKWKGISVGVLHSILTVRVLGEAQAGEKDSWLASFLNLSREIGTFSPSTSAESMRRFMAFVEKIRSPSLESMSLAPYARMLADFGGMERAAQLWDDEAQRRQAVDDQDAGMSWCNAGVAWAACARSHYLAPDDSEPAGTQDKRFKASMAKALNRLDKAVEQGVAEALRHKTLLLDYVGRATEALECANAYFTCFQNGDVPDTGDSMNLLRTTLGLTRRVKGAADAVTVGEKVVPLLEASVAYDPGEAALVISGGRSLLLRREIAAVAWRNGIDAATMSSHGPVGLMTAANLWQTKMTIGLA